MIKKLLKSIIRLITKKSKFKKINTLVLNGLPIQIVPALEYLVNEEVDHQTNDVIIIAEKRRNELASQKEKKVPIWYSPKPNSSQDDKKINLRPQPGKVLEFSMERIARTGKQKKWGVVLHLLSKEFKSIIGVELGTCAGISTIYLGSVPTMQLLLTVEGSKELSEIAKISLRDFLNVKVINSLFDEAIDNEVPQLGKELDFVYIDGHHEKFATLHYFNRLIPYLKKGALIIFDDIHWSYDMSEAWDILRMRGEFSHTFDFGEIGVCIFNSALEDASSVPTFWDFQNIVGKKRIGDPLGWKEL